MAPSPGSLASLQLPNNPHLYEINTWAWLEELSVRMGRLIRLGEVPSDEWDRLAGRGFHAVWLMGVWQRSAESRKIAVQEAENVRAPFDRALPGWTPSDIIGSPYAVAAYQPDPRIGGWTGLDAARNQLRARGLALFLDFVGNHTAFDHPWTHAHPEFYVRGSRQDFEKDPDSFWAIELPEGTIYLALARDPYFPAWKDVAQLNHFERRLRSAQIEELRVIASHCDGVRCDMAMLQLRDIFASIWGPLLGAQIPPASEFWADAHAACPGLILLGEAYWGTEPRLLDLGFSFVYDKALYDLVRDVRISGVRANLDVDVAYQDRLVRFLENHDEERCVSVFGAQRLASVATFMGTLPGMRFYHQGELEGRKEHLPIPLRMAAPQPADPLIAPFFEKILQITRRDVFHAGEWKLLPVTQDYDSTFENLIAYEWRLRGAWTIVVVNLSGTASQGRIQLNSAAAPGKNWIFRDELEGVIYPRLAEECCSVGLFVRRDAFGVHIFTVSSDE